MHEMDDGRRKRMNRSARTFSDISSLIYHKRVLWICMQFTLLLVWLGRKYLLSTNISSNIVNLVLFPLSLSLFWPVYKHWIYDLNWFFNVKVNLVIEIKYIKCFEIQIVNGSNVSEHTQYLLNFTSHFFGCGCCCCCFFSLFDHQREWLVFTHQRRRSRSRRKRCNDNSNNKCWCDFFYSLW